jgi:hypothetical protein
MLFQVLLDGFRDCRRETERLLDAVLDPLSPPSEQLIQGACFFILERTSLGTNTAGKNRQKGGAMKKVLLAALAFLCVAAASSKTNTLAQQAASETC